MAIWLKVNSPVGRLKFAAVDSPVGAVQIIRGCRSAALQTLWSLTTKNPWVTENNNQ